MRMLFEIDKKNYNPDGTIFKRPSARGIIIKDGRIAMVHSLKYDYYKFPGGGIEKDEDRVSALIREIREEAGLDVISDSIREYGMVHRIQKGDIEDVFIQDNFYYLCEVERDIRPQKLDEYEREEQFTLEFVTPEHAIETNRKKVSDEIDSVMVEREAKVLECLLKEGCFKTKAVMF